jgi:hypothetical protein
MATFTVIKKGETIEFNSYFNDLNAATEYLENNLSHNSFAQSLLEQNKLSAKQIAWVHYLATMDAEKANQPVVEGEFLPLVKKMYAAVKSPSRNFKLRLPDGLTISTVNKGVNVGCIYVFDNNEYVGKITTNGELKADNVSEDIKNLLEDANENLLALAKLFGHTTGSCSVCGRTLSDPLSVQLGMGTVCRKRFN